MSNLALCSWQSALEAEGRIHSFYKGVKLHFYPRTQMQNSVTTEAPRKTDAAFQLGLSE